MSSKKGSDNKGSEDSSPITDLSYEVTQSEEMDPLIGQRVQKYSIVSRVARGGTATVYRANDTVLNREVAFKILHEHLESRREVVERFRNEAKVVASLRHPNIVNVYDFLEHEGRAVLVAEFMPGATLSQLIKQCRRVPENIALMIGNEILQGLKSAHDKGITHRDIKPANILVNSEHGIKISDFGLAKLVHAEDGLTKEGIFIGTPSFSSPEQIEGKAVDHRSDLFSLGLCLYMLVSGSHAFKQKGDTTTTVWFKIVRGNFQGVREINPDLSQELEKILNRALEVKPEKRYQSAKEMMMDIEYLLKKRKVYPYSETLHEFLRRPYGVGGGAAKSGRWRKWAKRGAAALILFGLIGAGYRYSSFFLPLAPKTPVADEVAVPPPVVEKTLPEEVPPEVVAPVQEQPVPPQVKAPAVKPQSNEGMTAVTALNLPTISTVISPAGEKAFALRFQWTELAEFLLSSRPSFSPTIIRGRFTDRGYDWNNWEEGRFYWKAGNKRGEVLVESLESYRQRTRLEKRDLLVSSEYNEVDLQINPWLQQIRLSWDTGPNADIYRLEVAQDRAFQKIIFSGTPSVKWEKIERLWEKDQSIYWRVSYLDSAQNVFFKEPVHQINLKLSVSAPHFEILEPRPYQKIQQELSIQAVGPRQSKMRCLLLEKGQKLSSWRDLNVQGGFYVGSWKDPVGDLLCEGQKEGASTFFFIPLDS